MSSPKIDHSAEIKTLEAAIQAVSDARTAIDEIRRLEIERDRLTTITDDPNGSEAEAIKAAKKLPIIAEEIRIQNILANRRQSALERAERDAGELGNKIAAQLWDEAAGLRDAHWESARNKVVALLSPGAQDLLNGQCDQWRFPAAQSLAGTVNAIVASLKGIDELNGLAAEGERLANAGNAPTVLALAKTFDAIATAAVKTLTA